jgi:hypothetical protein
MTLNFVDFVASVIVFTSPNCSFLFRIVQKVFKFVQEGKELAIEQLATFNVVINNPSLLLYKTKIYKAL